MNLVSMNVGFIVHTTNCDRCGAVEIEVRVGLWLKACAWVCGSGG